MAELQRRMEEKSNRNQDEDLSDSYYDEMAALQAEEDFHRSMKLASQASPTGRYSQHMGTVYLHCLILYVDCCYTVCV